jgi:Ran GTPase-activating protein (RanGAP) involved in mRNA processing and transport
MKLGPRNCTNSVSMNDSMDCFDDLQIEELQNFDFVAEDLEDLIDEDDKFSINEYINGNYDY